MNIAKIIKKANENKTVESYAKGWNHLLKSMSLCKAVMVLSHRIRKFAAEKYGCKASEISFSECLRMAWAEMKIAKKVSSITTNSKGFVVFKNRDFTHSGDLATWMRLDGNWLTINMGNVGLSKGYADELWDFFTSHNINIPPAGMRVTVAL